MALPGIKLNIQNIIYKAPSNGNLIYNYAPFFNLKKSVSSSTDLSNLTLNALKAGINTDKPIDVSTEVAYDGSINLIINDKVNPLKMVNSRFYLTSSQTYNIADRKGNLDTNIYTEDNFKVESGLIKTVQSIITVDFLGIHNGGQMPVGNYTFYFKLADYDGNESDFIAESGKVICHIGDINQPTSIRGGSKDENSDKIIKFRLNNLDLAYDYINIYYTRTTGDGTSEITKTYKITDKFKINKLNTEISITGYENHIEIDDSEINIQYTNFDSVKTVENCQNITFAGNVTNDYSLFDTLEKYSLFITPSIASDESIGNLNYQYSESYPDTGYEYYNVNNIYYKLGYWEDIYRIGIVYIMNDYTLSPVFNIRGISTLYPNSVFNINSKGIDSEINYGEDYIIEGGLGNENSKGVFKIDNTNGVSVFNGSSAITPIGIKLNFNGNVVEGTDKNPGLKDLTKGFFIVRQKRIPSILAQAVGIATSSKSHTPIIQGTTNSNVNKWLAESFLHAKDINDNTPVLGSSMFSVNDSNILRNALICPEADIRRSIFNTFFNSTEYKLCQFKYKPINRIFIDKQNNSMQFSLGDLTNNEGSGTINTSLTLIEPGTELVNNGSYDFCSKAGDAIVGYKCLDANLGDYEDPTNTDSGSTQEISNKWSLSLSKLRGEFNTYVACNTSSIQNGVYYNIYRKDFDFSKYWKDYFKIRYNDSSPFMAISDRISWNNLNNLSTPAIYRGDCYINTYTHRMNWNFIDPELPTNKHIADPYTWYKNYRISKRASTTVAEDGTPSSSLEYRKLLLSFTYKSIFEPEWSGDNRTFDTGETTFVKGLLEPDNSKYKKYSEKNGTFGADKINTVDVNAATLGHWVTFKICSNVNLAMRDVDFTRPSEEALQKKKRGFFPLQSMDKHDALPESDVINNGISQTLGNKYYFEVPDVPFIQSSFTTRINYSNVLQQSSFTNGNRIFESKNYQDYSMEYGALVKLVEWYGSLIAIMEHGVLGIPVNERAMIANAQGENIAINSQDVLPKNPKVLSNAFGSIWPDSIVKTSQYIYGIDTVGKKIWRTNGQKFEIISDMKIQKFLNDNIQLKESDITSIIGSKFIKSHYNAFKQDIMFVFNYNGAPWNMCWNEILNKWVTRYTWFPEFSENIDNIFYTFAKDKSNINDINYKIWKHGFAGTLENSGSILPTYWYNQQEPFEFEFVVIGIQGIQKVFDNLKIISNKAEPESFIYEISGEGYSWSNDREAVINAKGSFSSILSGTNAPKKVPYITTTEDLNSISTSGELSEYPTITTLRQTNFFKDNKDSKSILTQSYQKGCDIKNFGRLRGNMQYVEDLWNVQIQPITFKYAYLSGGNVTLDSKTTEAKIRDKYIKVRIRYSGKDLAIITAIRTLFTISYS